MFYIIQSRPQCAFPVLIEKLALPHGMLPGATKPLPQAQITALRKHLHLVSAAFFRLRFPHADIVMQKSARKVVISRQSL